MKEKRKKVLFTLDMAWVIVIFILCTMPGSSIPTPSISIPHIDKIVHGGMFFIMSLLICLSLGAFTRYSRKKIYFIAISIAVIYGGIIEILQAMFFSRSGDYMDWFADIAGGIAGCLFYPVVLRIEKYFYRKKIAS